jgi:hypothetical protein
VVCLFCHHLEEERLNTAAPERIAVILQGDGFSADRSLHQCSSNPNEIPQQYIFANLVAKTALLCH